MIRRRQFLAKAASILSLPFLLFALSGLAADVPGSSSESLVFEEFASSCIDLGHYDARAKQLTVRFVGRKPERFYRYSNVTPEIWEKLRKLNESGGVGGYLIETVVQNPKKFPFEELTIQKFTVRPGKKKAGTRVPAF